MKLMYTEGVGTSQITKEAKDVTIPTSTQAGALTFQTDGIYLGSNKVNDTGLWPRVTSLSSAPNYPTLFAYLPSTNTPASATKVKSRFQNPPGLYYTDGTNYHLVSGSNIDIDLTQQVGTLITVNTGSIEEFTINFALKRVSILFNKPSAARGQEVQFTFINDWFPAMTADNVLFAGLNSSNANVIATAWVTGTQTFSVKCYKYDANTTHDWWGALEVIYCG